MSITVEKFLEVLATHIACDRFLTCMKLTPELWRQWEFDDKGARFIEPGQRDQENPGSRFFEMFACVKADWLKTADVTRTEAVQ